MLTIFLIQLQVQFKIPLVYLGTHFMAYRAASSELLIQYTAGIYSSSSAPSVSDPQPVIACYRAKKNTDGAVSQYHRSIPPSATALVLYYLQ
jgi:hypothetical protein